jgi:hypothetical protein
MNVKVTVAFADKDKPPVLLKPLKIVMAVPTPIPSRFNAARPLGSKFPVKVPGVPMPERLSVAALALPAESEDTTAATAPKARALNIINSV